MTMPTIWTDGQSRVLVLFNNPDSTPLPYFFVSEHIEPDDWMDEKIAKEHIKKHGLKKITKLVVED